MGFLQAPPSPASSFSCSLLLAFGTRGCSARREGAAEPGSLLSPGSPQLEAQTPRAPRGGLVAFSLVPCPFASLIALQDVALASLGSFIESPQQQQGVSLDFWRCPRPIWGHVNLLGLAASYSSSPVKSRGERDPRLARNINSAPKKRDFVLPCLSSCLYS